MKDVCNAVERQPKSITEIADETGRDRATVSKYLDILSDSEFIRAKELGREKKYYRYLSSDRQAGLELRGSAYQLSKLQERLDNAKKGIEKLIEDSATPEELIEDGDTYL